MMHTLSFVLFPVRIFVRGARSAVKRHSMSNQRLYRGREGGRERAGTKPKLYHGSVILGLTPSTESPDSAYGVFNLSGANCRFSPTARGLIIALCRLETSGSKLLLSTHAAIVSGHRFSPFSSLLFLFFRSYSSKIYISSKFRSIVVESCSKSGSWSRRGRKEFHVNGGVPAS